TAWPSACSMTCSTVSCSTSRPNRCLIICRGTFPWRNPGTFKERAYLRSALSYSASTSAAGTSTCTDLRAGETSDTVTRSASFTTASAAIFLLKEDGTWCERGESNPHGFPHRILSPARLPVPPLSREWGGHGEPPRT